VERNHFKQRIVGGLVLVALGVIVIPFLLDMHPGEEWWGKGNIPKKPDNGFVTRVLPLDEWSKQAQGDLAKGSQQLDAVPEHSPTVPAPAQAHPPSPSEPVPPAARIPPSAPETSPPVATPQVAGSSGGTEGWVVQLGSFSNQKNADELREKLQKMAYHVFVERITQDGQTVYRVRIGPQRQRSEADTIRDRLARELQLNAMVMHFP
jgi:DedD protein